MITRLNLVVPVLYAGRFLLDTFIKPFVLLAFYVYYKFIERTDYIRPLPKCKSRLLTMPAHKLADMIRRKEVLLLFLFAFSIKIYFIIIKRTNFEKKIDHQ
jgi:hypothetical protein